MTKASCDQALEYKKVAISARVETFTSAKKCIVLLKQRHFIERRIESECLYSLQLLVV